MRTPVNRKLRRKDKAFSLVEVVLAVGIVAFVLISILGLMSVGIKANRESADDIAVGLIVQHVSTSLRMEGFTKVNANTNYAPANTTPDFYYDATGAGSANGAGTADANTLYACTVIRSSPAALPASNVLFLKLQISWPLAAPEANRQKRTVQLSLSNRE